MVLYNCTGHENFKCLQPVFFRTKMKCMIRRDLSLSVNKVRVLLQEGHMTYRIVDELAVTMRG